MLLDPVISDPGSEDGCDDVLLALPLLPWPCDWASFGWSNVLFPVRGSSRFLTPSVVWE